MRKKEIKVDFHIRKNQRNLGKHFFQGVISYTMCITHYTVCITQHPMRTSQAYLPLSAVRRIIARKKLRTTIAQQPRIKVTSQPIFSVRVGTNINRRWRSLPSSPCSSSQPPRRSSSVSRPATTTPACGRRRGWTGRVCWSSKKKEELKREGLFNF